MLAWQLAILNKLLVSSPKLLVLWAHMATPSFYLVIEDLNSDPYPRAAGIFTH